MERWACADIPSLALQILLDAHQDWQGYPVAVVDKDTAQGVILQSNRTARQFEIKPGLRYAAGLALCKDLRAGIVEDAQVERKCGELLDALREFSPHVEADTAQPGLFWLRATGLDRLFGGFDAWARGMVEHLRELGTFVSITVGFTRFGTFAAARAEPVGWRVFESLQQEQDNQGRVPLDILGLPPEVSAKLDKLAVTRVREFLELPSSGVRKRFGPQAAHLWRLAHGGGELPLQPVAWDEPVQKSFDLDDPLADMTQLTFLVKSTLHPLLLELAAKNCDLRELDIALHLDDSDLHEVTVRPANPTLDEVRIVDLVRLSLERLKLPAPIVKVTIEAHGVLIHRDQSHLFRDNARRDRQVADHALARLQAEHPGAVFQIALEDRHLPEARFSALPFEGGVASARARKSLPTLGEDAVAARPSDARLVRRIFDRPQPLHRFDPDVGFGWLVRDLDEGVVTRTHGPHRVSGGWWLDGRRAVEHIVDRRRADTSTHHVSPRARYFARDAPYVEDEADASMSVVAPHRGEISKSPRNFPRNRGSQHTTAAAVGVSRDYWFAETDRGDVFWVYWDHRRRQWFLHGVVE